jgi:hypothetical protein
MFTGHNSKFWDDRYDESGYAYGTTPNQFLTEQHRLKSGMKTSLCPTLISKSLQARLESKNLN